MKNKIKNTSLVIVTLAWVTGAIIHASNATAQSIGKEGGGGDYVILEDHKTVVLADSFLDLTKEQPVGSPDVRRKLNPKLGLEVRIMAKVLRGYIPFSTNQIYKSGKLIDPVLDAISSVEGDTTTYILVKSADELKDFCPSGGKKPYLLPDGTSSGSVACTMYTRSGFRTYLLAPIFYRMSLRHKALLLVHERLTTIVDNIEQPKFDFIAEITTGLNAAMDLYKSEMNGIPAVATDPQVADIEKLVDGVISMEYRDGGMPEEMLLWRVWKNGGGLVNARAKIAATAHVCAGAQIGPNATVGENTHFFKFIGQDVKRLIVGDHSSVNVVSIEPTKLPKGYYDSADPQPFYPIAKLSVGQGSTLDGVSLHADGEFQFGSNGSIVDSSLIYKKATIGDRFHMSESVSGFYIPSDRWGHYHGSYDLTPTNDEYTRASHLVTGDDLTLDRTVIYTVPNAIIGSRVHLENYKTSTGLISVDYPGVLLASVGSDVFVKDLTINLLDWHIGYESHMINVHFESGSKIDNLNFNLKGWIMQDAHDLSFGSAFSHRGNGEVEGTFNWDTTSGHHALVFGTYEDLARGYTTK